MPEYAWHALRTAGRTYLKREADIRVEGEGNLPRSGPAIIAARHYHHLLDGAVLMATVPYPLHILVGLDWVRNPVGQKAMQMLCNAAGWPIVLRRDGKHDVGEEDARRALRKAYRQSVDILRKGNALLVFPEGYPTIDPTWTPKTRPDEFLPFQPGFAQIAKGAARLGLKVPIIPAGFHYEQGDRWNVSLRFGHAMHADRDSSTSDLVAQVTSAVKVLSAAS